MARPRQGGDGGASPGFTADGHTSVCQLIPSPPLIPAVLASCNGQHGPLGRSRRCRAPAVAAILPVFPDDVKECAGADHHQLRPHQQQQPGRTQSNTAAQRRNAFAPFFRFYPSRMELRHGSLARLVDDTGRAAAPQAASVLGGLLGVPGLLPEPPRAAACHRPWERPGSGAQRLEHRICTHTHGDMAMNSPHSTTAACLPRARAANITGGSEWDDDSVRRRGGRRGGWRGSACETATTHDGSAMAELSGSTTRKR
uniref:Uncharacterized protein n=1 Tax=Oryza meridionalis TaxID=40149 RepID=A0A0E0C1E2_9ORYZ